MNEQTIHTLYYSLLESWNKRDAIAFANHFTEQGNCIGFDGSQLNGRTGIEKELTRIFADHQTGRFVGKIQEIRFLSPELALVRAIASTIPPGKPQIAVETNAIQSLIISDHNNQLAIELYHNTPAQFHGRPELIEALTRELEDEQEKQSNSSQTG